MTVKKGVKNSKDVDKGLVAMFLRMSPEERLLANDNTARTILELRSAFRQQNTDKCRSQCHNRITDKG